MMTLASRAATRSAWFEVVSAAITLTLTACASSPSQGLATDAGARPDSATAMDAAIGDAGPAGEDAPLVTDGVDAADQDAPSEDASDGGPATIANGVYTLTCKTGGMNLDNGGSVSAGNAVYQWSASLGNTNQQWRISSLGDGKYTLVSLTSGMALDNGGSTTNGAGVTQNLASTSSPNQEWTVTGAGGGYYTLVCASSGKALDNGGATSNGGMVAQQDLVAGDSDQTWQIMPVQIGAATPFTSYEAEDGALAGGATVVSLTSAPTTEFTSPQLEASGRCLHPPGRHRAVGHLEEQHRSEHQFHQRALLHPRRCRRRRHRVDDRPLGQRAVPSSLSVNSMQTWVYETASDYDSMDQNPNDGNPHVFWDETHAFISNAPVAPGSTITLIQDAANAAAYYDIDVVDLEAAPPPLDPAGELALDHELWRGRGRQSAQRFRRSGRAWTALRPFRAASTTHNLRRRSSGSLRGPSISSRRTVPACPPRA